MPKPSSSRDGRLRCWRSRSASFCGCAAMTDVLRLLHLVDEAFAVTLFAQLRPIHRFALLLRLVLRRAEKLLDRLVENGVFRTLPGFGSRCFLHTLSIPAPRAKSTLHCATKAASCTSRSRPRSVFTTSCSSCSCLLYTSDAADERS